MTSINTIMDISVTVCLIRPCTEWWRLSVCLSRYFPCHANITVALNQYHIQLSALAADNELIAINTTMPSVYLLHVKSHLPLIT